jgi:cobalamin biosynthesis Mg chelatase CobN
MRGNPKDDSEKAAAGAKQMKMLRRIPQMLRFIPGTAQDLRAYFLTLQYWLGGSQENIQGMVHYLADRYASGMKARNSKVKVVPPVEYPEVGIYHPRMKTRLSDQLRRFAHGGGAPQSTWACWSDTAALLFDCRQRTALRRGNRRHGSARLECGASFCFRLGFTPRY